MTTKNKQYEITRTLLDGQEIRGTVLNKRKYYFLADLKRAYGSKFMTYLPTNPISLRIAVAGNSQTRQLVNVSEFKDSFRKYKAAKKPEAKPSTDKPKKHNAVQFELNFAQPAETKKVTTTALPVNAADSDALAFRAKTVRMNINKCIEAYSRKEVAAMDSLDVDREMELKTRIGKNYLTAYNQFDAGLAAANNVTVDKLGDYGLGKKGRSNGVKYLDTIQNKGLLDYLAEVVEHMFGAAGK